MKWLLRIGVILLALLLLLFVAAAVWPAPTDPLVEEPGVGSSSVEPSYSGLQRAFPETNEPADNPTTPAKAELGRLLFFDPILSGNNDISCAGCHHPDLGFSDGLPTATGPEGAPLDRNTPGLWNVAYAGHLFWDGRVTSLEEQVLVPLQHDDEMAVADTEELVAELQAIPEYVSLFDAAFGGDAGAVTMHNIQRALAAFERMLISSNSPFDRYAGGDFEALTPQQRRGLALFRSGATRCFECHAAPTFATETFRVVGVPDDDPGRAAIDANLPAGAFRVPTLRNVALSAPYMHDGSLATLEEVIDFYAAGGGRAHGNETVDPFVAGFELTERERADLVAFLLALTDEGALPEIPAAVPSGLPVVERRDNPAREVASATTPPGGGVADAREAQTLRVGDEAGIQAVVDQARPGDTVMVPYGVYYETVVIDTSDITLLGEPNEGGEWPILDGQGELADGIIASGNNFEVGYFHIRDYTDNGVLVEGVTGVHFHDIKAERTGTYGVYPVQSSDVLIERVEVTGVDDAGIYAGQSENVIVRDSVAYGNVLGIELENTLGGEVYNNHVYDNSVGIFLVLLPNLTSKVSGMAQVYDNRVEGNNHANFAPEGNLARLVPAGVGILILSSDDNEVYDNIIRDNQTTGLALFSLVSTGFFDELDIGPNPESNWMRDNQYENNGFDPDGIVKELGVPAGDIIWDGSGTGNVFDEPFAGTTFPPVLPGSGWPDFLQNAYWQALNALIALVS